jgi:VanZ family protein
MDRRVVDWGLVLAYMALIWALSAMPAPPRLGPDVPAHALEYAILAGLVGRAWAGGLARLDGRSVAASFLVATLYGATDELHQRFVPGREASGKDLLVDAAGSLASLLGLWGLARRRRRAEAPR